MCWSDPSLGICFSLRSGLLFTIELPSIGTCTDSHLCVELLHLICVDEWFQLRSGFRFELCCASHHNVQSNELITCFLVGEGEDSTRSGICSQCDHNHVEE